MRCVTSNPGSLAAASLLHVRGWAAVAAALVLSGCAVGPDFHRPRPPETATYTGSNQPAPLSAADAAQHLGPGEQLAAEWWQLFHAPALQEAMRVALAGSPTLAAADATLAEARQQLSAARGAFYPRVNANAGVQHSTSTSPLSQPGPTQYTLGVSASYPLDVFGGIRRGVEQQAAFTEMAQYQLGAAYLTLTGGVVTEALTIASARLQISTTEELIASDRKNLALTRREFEVGTAARSDVLTADSQLAADLTQLPSLQQQLVAARDALAALTGRPPALFQAHDFDIGEFTVPPLIPLTLPSQLVRRRPDVLAAEAQLHAASAAIGVAVAQEFPGLSLSGGITRSALQARGLFHDFNTLRAAGAAASAPLFAGGALRAQAQAAREAYRAQLATYESVVIEALGQVADDLWSLQHDGERLEVYRHSVDIAAQALKLQQSSYAVGRSNVLQLIDAERTYAQARLGLATAQIQQLEDTAGLLVALGGGWWQGTLR